MTTLERMPKNKKPAAAESDGREERKPVQIPVPWFRVLRRLAQQDEKHHGWYILKVLDEKAREAGFEDLPPLPWKESEQDEK